jgi:hypothetical protein
MKTLKLKNHLPNRRFLPISLTIAVFLAIAMPAAATIIDVGGSDPLPAPACPNDTTCRAVTGVTGYQIQIGAHKNPFLIHSSGRVVALTLKLPTLTDTQKKFFQQNYAGAPKVKLAILRPRARRGVPYRYVLASQSESFDVSNYLGSDPTFALKNSLTVRRGDVVALTVETWVPAFAIQQDVKTTWRASRDSKSCKKLDKATHEKIGEIRVYGCAYTTAQLLYKATVINDPTPTNTVAKPKK